MTTNDERFKEDHQNTDFKFKDDTNDKSIDDFVTKQAQDKEKEDMENLRSVLLGHKVLDSNILKEFGFTLQDFICDASYENISATFVGAQKNESDLAANCFTKIDDIVNSEEFSFEVVTVASKGGSQRFKIKPNIHDGLIVIQLTVVNRRVFQDILLFLSKIVNHIDLRESLSTLYSAKNSMVELEQNLLNVQNVQVHRFKKFKDDKDTEVERKSGFRKSLTAINS